MISENTMFLLCFTTIMMVSSVFSTNSSDSLLNTTSNVIANATKSPRLFNNNNIAISTGCFSADTLVTLANGKQIPIGQLRSGHQLRTLHGTTIINTQMIIMLDQSQHTSALFHTIMTASGHKLSLTPLHLVLTLTNHGEIEYKSAKDVKQGDIVRVLRNDRVYSSSVTNITIETKQGYYAPLTMAGTIVGNDVVASCYSNVKSHAMAQMMMFPFRWYYQLSRLLSIEKAFGEENVDGIHSSVKMMYEMVQLYYPTYLRLN